MYAFTRNSDNKTFRLPSNNTPTKYQYGILLMNGNDMIDRNPNLVSFPSIDGVQPQYGSKMEAYACIDELQKLWPNSVYLLIKFKVVK